jgi:TolA-binding protein
MTEQERKRLFSALSQASVRTQPELSPRVRQRVLEAHARATRPSALPTAYRWALGGIAVAVAITVLVLLRAPAAPSFQVASHSGQVGAWLTTEAEQKLALNFSEGSQVVLGKQSRGRVTEVSRGGARIELSRGAVRATVKHLPGAAWTFDAGPFEVAVLGTELGVSWLPDTGRFELSVTRGAVLVKGPFIARPQEVRAGQVCRVDLNRHLMELGRLGADAATHVAAEAAPSVASRVSAPETAPPAAEPSSSSAPPRALAASAESLLEEARAARLAGRPELERAALLACRKRAKGQGPAAQAAYLLGRASAAAEAAQWFETYLREEPRGLLAREASGRLIESYRAAGNVSAAHGAAARYLARYPDGPHAAMARQSLAARSESQD